LDQKADVAGVTAERRYRCNIVHDIGRDDHRFLRSGRRFGEDQTMSMRFCRVLAMLAIAAGAVLAPRASAAADWPPALQKVIAAAKQEGKLTLSTPVNVAGGADGAKAVAAGVASLFGVTLETSWAPAPSFGAMVAKLNQEFQAGVPSTTDVDFAAAPHLGPISTAISSARSRGTSCGRSGFLRQASNASARCASRPSCPASSTT
jgi:hypothetical protein